MPSIAILLRRQLDTPAATGASLSEKVLSQRSRQGPPPTAMQMKELEVGSQPDSDSIQKAERVHIVAETTVSIKSSRRSELESSHSPDLESGRPRPKISSPIPMRYDMHENEHNRPPSSSVCDDDSSQDRLVHSPEPFHRSANTSPGTPWQRLDWKDQQPPIHHTHERIQGMVRGQPTAMYSPRPRNSRAESPNWPLQ